MKIIKILFVLIPVVIIIIALTAGFIYLKTNSSPKKIFTSSINKIFNELEVNQAGFDTIKANIEANMKLESEDTSLEKIENAKINMTAEIDTKNELINDNIIVNYEDEDILNANLFMQDNKIYLNVPEWSDKYIQIQENINNYLGEGIDVTQFLSIDRELLLKAIKQELISVMSEQNYMQEKSTFSINEATKNCIKSTLTLNKEQRINIEKEILTNLKSNSDFQNALGNCRKQVIDKINKFLETDNNILETDNSTFEISIYTYGFLNNFAGVSIKYISEEDETQVDFTYKKNNNQGIYDLIIKNIDTNVNLSGNIIKENSKYTGTCIVDAENNKIGRLDLSMLYGVEYGVNVQKVDIPGSVVFETMTEEESEQLKTNIQESKFYSLFSKYADNDLVSSLNKRDGKVKLNNYEIEFDIADNWNYKEGKDDSKQYQNNDNTIRVYIDDISGNKYLEFLELQKAANLNDDYNMSDTKTYTYNGLEYQYKYLTSNNIINFYFVYELDEDTSYILELNSNDGNVSMDDVNNFLNIKIFQK